MTLNKRASRALGSRRPSTRSLEKRVLGCAARRRKYVSSEQSLDRRENGADLAEPRRGDEHAPARAVIGVPKTRAGLGETRAVLLGARTNFV